jgi:hypothetical protein
MADAQYDMLDAAALQEAQLVRHKGLASHEDQRLGQGFRQRSQARRQAACKYGYGEHEFFRNARAMNQ